MSAILSFGACVPVYRLPREVIAREWGQPALGGEKAVANHDEDSLTLAVNAALQCLPEDEPARLDAVFFASTTSPYREKSAAATIAAALDCGAAMRTADFTDSLRASTSALLAAFDALAAGAERVLVCTGDCRMGEPDTLAEQNYGDAGAALLLGRDGGLAEVVATHSVSADFHGTWRNDEQDFLHSFPGAFETKFGHARFVRDAAAGVLRKAGLEAKQIALAVIAGPNPRAAQGSGKALGFDAKTAVADTLWATIGDTGCAQPLLLLAAALERVKPGEMILLVGYGDGGDAILLRASETLAAHRARRGVYQQIERKRLLSSYGKYARFRRLVRRETPNHDLSTPVVLHRDQRAMLPLYGGRCPACGVVQFPRRELCIECGHRGLDEQRLARRGTVFTFTHDFIYESPETPVTHAVIELDGGGRLYLQMTDCDADAVEIDTPVELTFRAIHEGSGVKNYFWKARPIA